MVRIDNLINEGLIETDIDLIKIDIEGYEYKALQGMGKLLYSQHPYLIIEIDEKLLNNFDSSPKDVILFLQSHGYKHFINVESGEYISETMLFQNCHFDMACS